MTKIVNCYKNSLEPKVKSGCLINLRIFNTFLLVVICGISFAYLIGVSDLTVKGFALQELRTQAAKLAEQKLSYEQQVDAIQSYYVLSERAKSLNMVAISDIEYLQAANQSVAKK
jgi:hypothetical protein